MLCPQPASKHLTTVRQYNSETPTNPAALKPLPCTGSQALFCLCCVAQRQLIKLAGANLCKNWRALAPKARLKAPQGASQQLAFKGNVSQQVLLRAKDHGVQADARLAAMRVQPQATIQNKYCQKSAQKQQGQAGSNKRPKPTTLNRHSLSVSDIYNLLACAARRGVIHTKA